MYSVVLMAAITAGSASQDCCFSGLSCCYPVSCYGAYGGGCSGWGGGYSGVGYGCGCYGGGGYGCGCYGGGFINGYPGCYGGGYGMGFGGACYGGCYGCVGVITTPYQAVPMVTVPKTAEPLPNPKKGDGGDQARAKVIIDVPADAVLFIDDQQMPNKAGKRTFVTPELRPGQSYFYDVKIVVNQGGQQQVQTSRVVLRPGEVVAATFSTQNTGPVIVAPKP